MNDLTLDGYERDMPMTYEKFSLACDSAQPIFFLDQRYVVVSVSVELGPPHSKPRMRVVLRQIKLL